VRAAFLLSLLVAQIVVGARVLARLIRTAGGSRIAAVDSMVGREGAVSAIVPVLNERARLGPCLDGLTAQGAELLEILVVDGGSQDDTKDLVAAYSARDNRIQLLDASPVPPGWNGKAWGLEVGARSVAEGSTWILTVDADVRPRRKLVASLLAHTALTGLGVLSVATEQELSSPGSALVHPALLASLVYRYGIPGRATRRVSAVQANGQCMLIRRDILTSNVGFAGVRSSPCEDVTLARQLALRGHAVGFYESNGLVSVRMYESGWETLTGWTRSLPLRDQIVGWAALLGLAEVTLVQALPLLVVATIGLSRPTPERISSDTMRSGWVGRWLWMVNVILLVTRLGVLAGTARAYTRVPLAYWLSPLLDVPATIQLWRSALAREHHWRGRVMVARDAA
jgi:dolichol-phosphate mannosyltransferase